MVRGSKEDVWPVQTTGEPWRVLYLPTTKAAHVQQTLPALISWCRSRQAVLTLVLGTHEDRLRPVVEKVIQNRGAQDHVSIFGWRDDVPLLMRQAHLTVTKAGGATVR